MRPLFVIVNELRATKAEKEKLEIKEGILVDELVRHRDFKRQRKTAVKKFKEGGQTK